MARIVVVVGHDAPFYFKRIPWMKEARSEWAFVFGLPCRVEVNLEPERGMFSSLQIGLATLVGDACFVLPVDVPAASGDVWRALASGIGESSVARPTAAGGRGHPVLLSADLASSVLDASSGSRLDEVLSSLSADQRTDVPVSDATVLANLNSPDDWTQWRREGPESRRTSPG